MKQNERWALTIFILTIAMLNTSHPLIFLLALTMAGTAFALFVWGNE